MAHRHLSRRRFLAGACGCCACALTQSYAATPLASVGDWGAVGLPALLELGSEPMARIGQSVWVAKIAPNLWMHSTTHTIPGGIIYPANGLIVERVGGDLLIDTAWTPDQADLLISWAKKSLSTPITLAVATHFHDDRTGGVEALKKHGIRTVAHPLTCALAETHGMPVPESLRGFENDSYRLDDDCELFFPGAGHTRDNVVAWMPKQQVLFGGCFLKSVTSGGLGNVDDAVIPDWAGSVRRVEHRYPSTKITVPGHGTITGNPVAQTLALLSKESGKR